MRKSVEIQRLKRLVIFAKAQTSAFIGGICDYCFMICFTELAGLHYTLSIVIACVLGAVINFTINQKWSFYSKVSKYKLSNGQQIGRFILVAGSSILLKMVGTYLLTSSSGIDYKISRIITDMCVSLFYNYVLQRFWVFRQTLNQQT